MAPHSDAGGASPVDTDAAFAGLEELVGAPRFALVTDLDGSVVPFAVDPSKAVPSAEVIRLLEELAALDGTLVVVASGRSREDLERFFGTSAPLELVAEHGLWIREQGTWRLTKRVAREPLVLVASALRELCAAYEGSRVEEKTRGLVVHVRGVAADAKAELLARASEIFARTIAANAQLEMLGGNEVLELRVAGATKASAVHLVRSRLGVGARAIALGDDVTDEDMFRVLAPTDVGFRIGRSDRPTAATRELADTVAAIALLARIVDERRTRFVRLTSSGIEA